MHNVVQATQTPFEIGICQDGTTIWPFTRCCLSPLERQEDELRVVCQGCKNPYPRIPSGVLLEYVWTGNTVNFARLAHLWTGLPEAGFEVKVEP